MRSFLKYTLTSLKYTLASLLLFCVLTGCEKEYTTIEQLDQENIEAYIKQNSLNMQDYDNSGIQYQLISQGTGKPLDFSKPVAAIFTAKSLDGKFIAADTMAFYNRYYGFLGYIQPNGRVGFANRELIPKLIKSVLVNEGGALRFIIPSKLAYGRNISASIPGYTLTEIPGNSSLDITVKVLKSDKLEEYADETIKHYLEKNSLSGFTKTSTGVYYKISSPGTGSPISIDSTITVEYTRRLLDGKIYETATSTNPLKSPLTNLIPAWKDVVPLIKRGGAVRLITPYTRAYGTSAAMEQGVAPFLQMDFEIKVAN